MNYLLDTNVASEIRKRNCNINVKRFVDNYDRKTFFISAVSIGEISYGVERLPPGEKKIRFAYFLNVQIPEWFEDRIIPVDREVMREWGRICARIGRTLPLLDSLIAATALARGFTVATRNTRDFADIEGILLLNPWEFPA
ncbi:MAG: type II toxin-antitoxin system VapC family toxin [Treponema sp.]|nr:type II toxin-antitoxin system VapC family toxin [Treponema sp.]